MNKPLDILKYHGIDDIDSSVKKGDVQVVMDKEIAKRTWSVNGPISATNYILVSFDQSFNLKPRLGSQYLYLQVKSFSKKYYSIHITVEAKLGHSTTAVKISISNSFTSMSRKSSNHIQIPVHLASDKWTVLAIDMKHVLTSSIGQHSFHSFKSLHLCSSIRVRGAYLSDTKHSSLDLPQEMALPVRDKALRWEDLYRWHWLLDTNTCSYSDGDSDGKLSSTISTSRKANNENDSSLLNVSAPVTVESGGGGEVPRGAEGDATHVDEDCEDTKHVQFDEESSPAGRSDNLLVPRPFSSPAVSESPSVNGGHPLLKLRSIIGFTGFTSGNVLWCRDGNSLIYPSGSNLVILQTKSSSGGNIVEISSQFEGEGGGEGATQIHVFGHTANICSLAVSSDGSLAASGQEGKFPMVRVWCTYTGKCLAILGGHAAALTSVDISSDGTMLVASGSDTHGKSQIIVWDIKHVRSHRHTLKARQTSEHPISRILFSPYESGKLVSVGRDNIRFWRIKGEKILSCPVILNDYARNTLFTDLAFESSYGVRPVNGGPARHVFATTAVGTMLQINYEDRSIDCVFRLHDGPIHSISVNEGFCVTGSSDNYLRVWPLDFSDYFLEAKHEGPISSLAISANGLQIAAGTTNGTLGLLDVSSHNYTTLLRSHTLQVNDAAINCFRNEISTVSDDGTIRIWDMFSREQLYEFDIPKDIAQAVAAHPHDHVIAAGFASGSVRVFNAETAVIMYEYNQHRGPIKSLMFSPDGCLLFSSGSDSHICVYDALDCYTPMKMVSSDVAIRNKNSSAISPDGMYLGAIGAHGTSVVIFSTANLAPITKIHPHPPPSYHLSNNSTTYNAVAFSADSKEVIVATSAKSVARFSVSTGELIREFNTNHRSSIDIIASSPCGRFILTAGKDSVIRVWNHNSMSATAKVPPCQSFLGHRNGLHSLNFSDDGNYAVTVGQPHEVLLWSSPNLQFGERDAARGRGRGGKGSGTAGGIDTCASASVGEGARKGYAGKYLTTDDEDNEAEDP